MATIGFIPFPEMGHLNASLKLARTMKSRGHQVCYLGLVDLEDAVRAQQFDFIPILEDVFPKGFRSKVAKSGGDTFDVIVQELRQRHGELDRLRNLGRVMTSAGADLFVIDIIFPAIARVAKHIGIPSVFINILCQSPWTDRSALYESLDDIPEFILCPEEFNFGEPLPRKNSYYVEASIDQERSELPFPWEKLRRDKRLIYCSFGSQSHMIERGRQIMKTIADAMSARPDWQLVLATGKHISSNDLGAIPANVIAVEFAPQLGLLKRASIMITHGGLNTVKECIFYGVPMILFALVRDQPAVAARVLYHGLGVRGNPNEISVAAINSLIDEIVQSPSIRARVEFMKKRFRELEQSGRMANILESIISGRGIEGF